MPIGAAGTEQAHLVPEHVADKQSVAHLVFDLVPVAYWQVLVERYPKRWSLPLAQAFLDPGPHQGERPSRDKPSLPAERS